MGRNIKLVICAISLLVLSAGCITTKSGNTTKKTSPTTNEPFCPQPYIEYKRGECCLDSNSNRICDKDETTTSPQTTNPQTTQPTTTKQATTILQTTQATSTTIPQQCPQGSYDNDPACKNACLAGQRCRPSGVTITFNGQPITCYQCAAACPADDPDRTYYYNDSSCAVNCSNAGNWACVPSVTYAGCFSCDRLCPANYFYKSSTCRGECDEGEECTKSTQLNDCYWCKSPCPEGYFYKDPACDDTCGINERCEKTTSSCYLCVQKCDEGYYYQNSTCNDDCGSNQACIALSSQSNCYYCADLPDCEAYCGDRGSLYEWINDGAQGSPDISTSAECSAWATQKLNDIQAQCHTSCASSSFKKTNTISCCCVAWNSIDCDDCPGENPVCPPVDECMDTL
ncbi:MAG: hypothetical protein PHG85_00645 [Candidatus Altiarchaeota archaeon]|nr:hypothetical protein [Candidatus Altiarchaeota archaeon]